MSTAEKIIILRKYLNLSQAALGSRIGFTPTYISSMERGKVEVPDEVIEKILKEFGIQEFDFEKYKINAEDSKPLEKFALRLKNLRKSMGMTQSQFADFVGCDRSSISKLESKPFKLTNLLAEQIAEKCHVGVDWLLFGDENKKEFPVDRRMEAFLWKHKELREKIYRMMEEE